MVKYGLLVKNGGKENQHCWIIREHVVIKPTRVNVLGGLCLKDIKNSEKFQAIGNAFWQII